MAEDKNKNKTKKTKTGSVNDLVGGQAKETVQPHMIMSKAPPETTREVPQKAPLIEAERVEAEVDTAPTIKTEIEGAPTRPAGLFGSEPRPVKIAEPIEKPSVASQALKYGTSLFPIIGHLAGIPYERAQEEYAKRVKRDELLATQFLEAVDEDPVKAKQLARVDAFRDAAQRHLGMSPQEIIDFDKSITEQSALSRRPMSELLIKKGYLPEGGTGTFKTEFGELGPVPEKPEYVETKSGAIIDKRSGEIVRDRNKELLQERIEMFRKSMPKDTPDLDVRLMALGSIGNPNKRLTVQTTDAGNMFMVDQWTGDFWEVDTSKKSGTFEVETISSQGVEGTYDGVLLHNKHADSPENAMPTYIPLNQIKMPSGMTLQDMVNQMTLEDPTASKGVIMKLIEKVFGGAFDVFDRASGSKLPIQEKAEQRKQNENRTRNDTAAPTLLSPPKNIRDKSQREAGTVDAEEIEKKENFFSMADEALDL